MRASHLCLYNDRLDPLLHGALAVQYVALCALPPELENSVEEDHHAQRQNTRNGYGHCFLCAPSAVQFDDNIRIAIVIVALFCHWRAPVPVWVCGQAITTHEVPQDGSGVTRLHTEQLVVELPVLLPLIKVSKPCAGGSEQRTLHINIHLHVLIFNVTCDIFKGFLCCTQHLHGFFFGGLNILY